MQLPTAMLRRRLSPALFVLLFCAIVSVSIALENTCNGVPFEVSISTFDGDISQIVWIKSATGLGGLSGFLMTGNNSVYRSDDAGASWATVKDQLTNFTAEPPHFCSGVCSGAAGLVPTSDKSALFIVGYGGLLWVYKGETNTYEVTHNPDILYFNLFPHPTNGAVVAATHVSPCCWNGPDTQCVTCVVYLSVSDNFGVSWTRVDSYVHVEATSVVWTLVGNASTDSIERGDEDPSLQSDSFLLYVRFNSKFGDQRRMRVPVSSTELVLVNDYRFPIATSSVVVERGVAAAFVSNRVFALSSSDDDVSEMILMSSKDGRFFRPERIPDSPDTSNLFVPGHSNIFPILVLPDGKIFFYAERKTLGLYDNDVYSYNPSGPDTPGLQYSMSSIRSPGEIFAAKTPMGTFRPIFANRRMSRDSIVSETILSYDAGETWLEPRALLLNGENCSTNSALMIGGGCRFHFLADGNLAHHFSDATSAAGLALATGNLGKALSTDPTVLSSFISRDGGFSWKMIRDGSNLVAMSTRAQTMIIMDDKVATDSFVASFDIGSKWSECTIANSSAFLPSSVVTDPADALPRFLLLGSVGSVTNGTSLKRNAMLHLLFKPDEAATEIRNCSFPDDYEPRSGMGLERCFFGRHLQILAKKANATCRDTTDVDRRVYWEACPCTEDDFTCDKCFLRSGSKCFFSKVLCPDHPLATQLFNCKGLISSIYTGYQKHWLSSCEGGVDLSVGVRTHQCSSITVINPTPWPTLQFPRPVPEYRASVQPESQAENNKTTIVLAVLISTLIVIFGTAIFCGLLPKARQYFARKELGDADLSAPNPAPEEPNPFVQSPNTFNVSLEESE